MKIIVAVDGPAGSGKSSVSRAAALESGIKYIDSGAIYRSVTWFLLNRDGKVAAENAYDGIVEELNYKQIFNLDGSTTSYVNGIDVTDLIREEVIVKNIGIVSDNINIRRGITSMLRQWGNEDSLIMDGRDIGTVVFPDADLKIYLDASVDERAHRRFKEYLEKGKNVDLNEIKNQIILRDRQDMSRSVGALKKASDSIVIDTSCMTREQVIEKFINLINGKSNG
ncbi:MAG: (d)CMP kinase [Spirochaetes bacterium]|nr:(d)CMP kinase [Spirochaetota bacterium]